MEYFKDNSNVLMIIPQGESTATETELDGRKCNVTLVSADKLQSQSGDTAFDTIISGYKYAIPIAYTSEFLSVILKRLNPGGDLIICNHSGVGEGSLEFELKTNGFINVKREKDVLFANKPNYAVGSTKKLNLQANSKVNTVWKLDDTVDDEIIDQDNLLDEDDLKKPDPASLRVCGTTGKRKACKDCSCGLADELAGEKVAPVDPNTPKSSCGNCYLGDAFRCAACPYLGMPAFKPGEKIQLSDNQLKADA